MTTVTNNRQNHRVEKKNTVLNYIPKELQLKENINPAVKPYE